MLNILHLSFEYVDVDTGELIRKYKYQHAVNGDVIDTSDFVTDRLLSSHIASFKRGTMKLRNLSLQINFNVEKVF